MRTARLVHDTLRRLHGTPLELPGGDTVSAYFVEHVVDWPAPGGTPVRGWERYALVDETDAASLGRGDTVVIGGSPYRVRDVEPAGAGSTRVVVDPA